MRIAPAADVQVDRDVPYHRLTTELFGVKKQLFRLRNLQSRKLTHKLRERNLRHRLDNLRRQLANLRRQVDDFCRASFRYIPLLIRYQITRICSVLSYLHKASIASSVHMDLKLSNIVHADNFVPKITDFGLRRLLLGGVETPVPLFRAACKRKSPCDVEFTVAASAKGGTEIKIGSHVMLVPKYMRFGDTFACLKSVAPKRIFDMAKRLCSSASPNVCGADWIFARPVSESPKLRTDSEFNTGKSFGSRNEPTENESHHRAEHSIKEGKAKTAADWVVATAAPHHATGNIKLLSGFIIDHDDQFIHAVDGIPMKVIARGAVVTDTMVLPDVWFVPGLTENLVSVSQLAELDYSVGFGFSECCIRSAANGKIMGKAHLQERGQYVLDFLKVPLAI